MQGNHSSVGDITLRLAKPSDAGRLAELHYLSRESGAAGFFSKVSRSFLKHYYKVVLDDPYSVVICAEASDGKIKGLASGTLDAEKHFARLAKHRLMFGLLLIPSMLTSPELLRQAFSRFRSSKGGDGKKFVVTRGARTETWIWFPSDGS